MICWSPVVVFKLWISDPLPLRVMFASSVTISALFASSRTEPASDGVGASGQGRSRRGW